jgi:hypothetical protein
MLRDGCGVTASGDDTAGVESRLEREDAPDVPFVAFAGVEASAGRNWTRIFFSWI